MGMIKDGTISGILPSDSQGFVVHYPGYPSSISRAIDTLGGVQGILKARSSESNKLELYFRPEDPYSHPAFGELRPCNGFLLKISKRKPRDGHDAKADNGSGNRMENEMQANQPESEGVALASDDKVEDRTSADGEANLCADIVARVPEAYCFNGMFDYQHVIPVHADVARRKKRTWSELEEPHFDKGGLMDVDHEDVMLIVPPLFAPKDMPENLVLRPPTTLSSKKRQEGNVQPHFEMDTEPVLAIDFDIKEIPKIVNWEEYIPQGSDQWESQMAVSRMFDERPIWPKESLTERLLDKGLRFSHGMLRRLLSRISYYFSSGPFLRFWIKKGYDPRKDPDSCIYQRLDYRVPIPLRSYCDAQSANTLKPRWEDICAFRAFPYKFQTSLQLFELVDDYIQSEIKKPPLQAACTFATGWFSHHMLNCIRQRIMVRFLSILPKPGTENLLRAATARFEKMKRECSKNATKPEGKECEQANLGLEENDEPDNVEDDEGEAAEANNSDEEWDAYEELDLDGDGELPLPSHSSLQYKLLRITLSLKNEPSLLPRTSLADQIALNPAIQATSLLPLSNFPCKESVLCIDLNMDNISRTHLQELFGSFPSNEFDNKYKARDNGSDEEYHIYEEDSDNNYSDE